ncbi:hypothetical protein [Helicobacter sp. 16-1353]|nr:hypothetical protein [Helicobacter sp. 16-1353]
MRVLKIYSIDFRIYIILAKAKLKNLALHNFILYLKIYFDTRIHF